MHKSKICLFPLLFVSVWAAETGPHSVHSPDSVSIFLPKKKKVPKRSVPQRVWVRPGVENEGHNAGQAEGSGAALRTLVSFRICGPSSCPYLSLD